MLDHPVQAPLYHLRLVLFYYRTAVLLFSLGSIMLASAGANVLTAAISLSRWTCWKTTTCIG